MPYNFSNIFSETVQKITIPRIQRDYAQGRENLKINRIRHNFLDALFNAVQGKPIKLDFVYGNLEKGILTPLDGQQRLTTLFLLYWYAAKKENIADDETFFLKKFSYETRPDSEQFCKEIVNFSPNFNQEILSAEIEDQSWFPLSWKKDPTISAMLTMIDAIHEKFKSVKNIWQGLSNIEFYFLPIEELGLADEIYITMNSRGKILTDFENFKAEFKRRLDDINTELSKNIILKIDREWTDMLWKIAVRNEDYLVDDYFLNYFRFLCDLEIYKRGKIPKKDRDFFALLDEFFSGDISEKLEELNKNFECWCACGDTYKFFGDRVLIGSKSDKIYKHAAGKFVGYFQMKDDGNFFVDCLKNSYEGKLAKILMLYAFLVYLRNKENNSDTNFRRHMRVEEGKISDTDFRRRIRVVNNLISNSEDEIREQFMQTLLQQVENIIKTGEFLPLSGKQNFSAFQVQEEKLKLEWTKQNPNRAESLFALEDHYLLYGQIEIIGLENAANFINFISLFTCDYDLINCALLATGDYYQQQKSKKVHQFGSKNNFSWQNLFHYNQNNIGYNETKNCLNKLLTQEKTFDNSKLEKIIGDYLKTCKSANSFDWKYYYIRYDFFRPAYYGKYFWANFTDAPYLFTAYKTKDRISSHAYPPFLFGIVEPKIFFDKYIGIPESKTNAAFSYLDFGKFKITCTNDGYAVTEIETGRILQNFKIKQDNGIDTEDRIQKFKTWIRKNI